jgi:hypothetical protein
MFATDFVMGRDEFAQRYIRAFRKRQSQST